MPPPTPFLRRHLPSASMSGTSTDAGVAGPTRARTRTLGQPRTLFELFQFETNRRPECSRRPALISLRREEETNSWYSVKNFYPATIGEIFQNTYQVIAKLGYGTASTSWLCRGLRHHRYVTLKIYASRESQTAREVAALTHINAVLAASQNANHRIGAASVRTLDQFQISRPRSS